MSADDRRRMTVLARDLAEAETSTLVEGGDLRSVLMWANEQRRAQGIDPLPVWEAEIESMPEHMMWRRGRALGLARRRR